MKVMMKAWISLAFLVTTSVALKKTCEVKTLQTSKKYTICYVLYVRIANLQ